ncbi:MAG TPA: thiol-disulfide oxidoreductase DCC family protein [Rudaea sp.]
MSDEAPILVFDGVCVLCSRSVQFVLRHDRARRFRFATVQSSMGAQLMRRVGFDPARPASVLLVEGDRVFVESAAAIRVLSAFGGAWTIAAAALWIVPRPLRNAVYRLIATRRYRWFGRRETCYLPGPEDAGRFLE